MNSVSVENLTCLLQFRQSCVVFRTACGCTCLAFRSFCGFHGRSTGWHAD